MQAHESTVLVLHVLLCAFFLVAFPPDAVVVAGQLHDQVISKKLGWSCTEQQIVIKNRQKLIKPTRLPHKYSEKPPRSRSRSDETLTNKAQREENHLALAHPHSFASPARTHDTKRKRRRNEADLPVQGVLKHYSPKPPINVIT